ncbi:MAG TPA: ATP-binding protein [Thermoanaerobaculia bacterium]|nr:ATP-binding protein [Thermoanaerobaculia bacterium]
MRPRFTRDNRILVAIAASLGAALATLYALVLKSRALAAQAAANRVVLFVLFYIVVLLILTLLFVLGRSAAKLVLETRRGVFGSRFRVRVVATHVGLALLPIALLLLPTSGLLQRSVERWFRPPVVQTVRAGQEVTDLVRRRAAALERRAADRLAPALAAAASDAERFELLKRVREELALDLAEWRNAGAPVQTLAVSAPRWPVRGTKEPGADWLADARARGSARRLEQTADGGQIGRTVTALPGGFLVLGTYDPPEEAGPLRTLARATSTYAMLEAERASLEAIEVLLFLLLAFLVLLASVWAGLLLARRVTRPIGALASSARRIAAGDFDAMVEEEGGDEIGALARAFNAMTKELRKSREGLVDANAELVVTNERLDEQRRRVRAILANLGAGVVAWTDEGALLFTNETARRLLGWDSPGEPAILEELLAAQDLAPARELFARASGAAGPIETTLTLSFAQEARVLEARVTRIEASGGESAVHVATLEDTTALVKAERAAAWREAAQRMAHEIKNPLTPIRLAAERMHRRARAASGADEGPLAGVVEEGASTIVEEVTTLSSLVDAFGRFARLPAADLAETDLAAVVSQVTKLYDGVKPGVRVTSEAQEEIAPVKADAEQIKRALINLVDNAVAATPPGGRVVLAASVDGGKARVAVSDTGPGLSPSERTRVFDPDYSTKSRGTGLGLAIVERIAAEHAGRVFVEENAPKGCRFVLEWPAA